MPASGMRTPKDATDSRLRGDDDTYCRRAAMDPPVEAALGSSEAAD